MTTGRYAPSPTGDLHLGNARTALLAWLWARAERGRFLLRLEDLDAGRVRDDVARRQVEDLERLGLDWDGPVVRQSDRRPLYEAATARLEESGSIYPCFCSRADVAAAASAPHGPEGPAYPGTCRGIPAARARARLAAGEGASLRFRIPHGAVTFDDAVHGRVEQDPTETGDVVVRRRDGAIAYNLAVVVDDDAQAVDQIVRGDDLLPTAGRQIALRRALGIAREPRYAHVPLLLGADGVRLAKRHGAPTLREALHSAGRARVLGWLARSAGLDGDDPPHAEVLFTRFDPASLTRTPAVVDADVFGPAATVARGG